MKCEYGCDQEALYQFNNGIWCCSEHFSKCPVKRKNSSGRDPWNKGKTGVFSKEALDKMSKFQKNRKHSDETKKKISEKLKRKKRTNEHCKNISKAKKGMKLSDETKRKLSDSHKGRPAWNKGKTNIFSKESLNKMRINSRLSISKYKERYPLFSKIEEMRYNPDKPSEKEIQVRCKNHKCPNSKEQNGWFTPSGDQFSDRRRSIEDKNGSYGSYFYCSQKCKNECPLYNIQPSQLIKEHHIKSGIVKEVYYTRGEYDTWRREVLKRANYKCEYCEEKATDAHHSRPQKLEPFFSLDPDFGIACCKKCHYKKGHKNECSSDQLASAVCI